MANNEKMDLWFAAKVKRLNDRMAGIVEQVAEEGQGLMQEYIETRGTATAEYGGRESWSRTYHHKGIPKGRPTTGRIWSGDMRADVKQNVVLGDDVMIASFGWLDNVEKYYKWQEEGFNHVFIGEHIAGMFAMSDAAEVMKERAHTLLKVAIREF